MAIKLEFTDYCKGCKYAELDINDRIDFFDIYAGSCSRYVVHCSHADICAEWAKKMAELIEGEKDVSTHKV